jgi:hypothetical protein
MKMHRVGTVTLGVVLVIFGLLFLVRMIVPSLDYVFIFKLWPIMLIALGIEVLLANIRSEQVTFIYDKGAIFLMIIICFFSMSMATMEIVFSNLANLKVLY